MQASSKDEIMDEIRAATVGFQSSLNTATAELVAHVYMAGLQRGLLIAGSPELVQADEPAGEGDAQ